MPQSDVGATSQKGIIIKVNNKYATIGRLSDITDRAYNKCMHECVMNNSPMHIQKLA